MGRSSSSSHSSYHHSNGAERPFIPNPYSISYDQEEAQETAMPLPLTPHQRKLGVFAVCLLLLSFTCFSWVAQGPTKAPRGRAPRRLPASAALDALQRQQQEAAAAAAMSRSLAGVSGFEHGTAYEESVEEHDEPPPSLGLRGSNTVRGTPIASWTDHGLSAEEEQGEGGAGLVDQEAQYGFGAMDGQEAVLEQTARAYRDTEDALIAKLVEDSLELPPEDGTEAEASPPPPIEDAEDMAAIADMEKEVAAAEAEAGLQGYVEAGGKGQDGDQQKMEDEAPAAAGQGGEDGVAAAAAAPHTAEEEVTSPMEADVAAREGDSGPPESSLLDGGSEHAEEPQLPLLQENGQGPSPPVTATEGGPQEVKAVEEEKEGLSEATAEKRGSTGPSSEGAEEEREQEVVVVGQEVGAQQGAEVAEEAGAAEQEEQVERVEEGSKGEMEPATAEAPGVGSSAVAQAAEPAQASPPGKALPIKGGGSVTVAPAHGGHRAAKRPRVKDEEEKEEAEPAVAGGGPAPEAAVGQDDEQTLPSELRRRLVTWLRAEGGGVHESSSTGRVSSWASEPVGKDHDQQQQQGPVFRALEGQRLAEAERAWREGIRRERRVVEKGEGDEKIAPPEGLEERSLEARLVTAMSTGGAGQTPSQAAVSFPCGLVADGLQLKDGQTVYVVLAPSWLEAGDQVPGQRFLGHYPHGQLRFHDRLLAFKTDSGDYLLEASRPFVRPGHFLIAGYRFNSNIEISINGRGFEAVPNERGEMGEPPVFSRHGGEGALLTVGGVNADCGFLGLIAEVLVFDSPLSDADAGVVSEYLGRTHGIELLRGGPVAVKKAREEGAGKRREEDGASDVVAAVEAARAAGAGPLSSRAGKGGGRKKEEGGGAGEEEEEGLALLPARCRSGSSPFQGSVEEFEPPKAATLAELQAWTDALGGSKATIRGFKGGGKALRDFIHGEVRQLERLRHRLFCKYVVEDGEPSAASTEQLQQQQNGAPAAAVGAALAE